MRAPDEPSNDFRAAGGRPLEELTLAEARRIALAAQGFGPRPRRRPGAADLLRGVRANGLLQIDSVNVLVRAHYLPLFSRLGAYRREDLEGLAWGPRPELFEYWAHEASLLPLEAHRLLRWRMARAERGEEVWSRMAVFAGERRGEAEAVLARITAEGPRTASELASEKGPGGWWGWSGVKTALEWLFWSGRITTRTRRPSFERVYDLTERVLPPAILAEPTPPEDEAQRTLILAAARRLGAATAPDLRDYWRLPARDAQARIAECLEEGTLRLLKVGGSDRPWLAPSDLEAAPPFEGSALLAPFDPLIWNRPRTERLFGARYRLEIYTPAEKRVHGYYVLPFLLGETLAARVDLKADRVRSRLLVRAASLEPGAPRRTARALVGALERMALWLGLEATAADGPCFPALGALLPTL